MKNQSLFLFCFILFFINKSVAQETLSYVLIAKHPTGKIDTIRRFNRTLFVKKTNYLNCFETTCLERLIDEKFGNASASAIAFTQELNKLNSDSLYEDHQILVPNRMTFFRQGRYKNTEIDIVLFPDLRTKLFAINENILHCRNYSDIGEVVRFKGIVDNIKLQNLPLAKQTLDQLIAYATYISSQTRRNCGADDTPDTWKFHDMADFALTNYGQAIIGNVSGYNVTVNLKDIQPDVASHTVVYFKPINSNIPQGERYPSAGSPTTKKLPIADYVFWAGSENIDQATWVCSCPEGVSVRAEMTLDLIKKSQ